MLISDGGGGTSWMSMSMEDMQRLIQNPDIEKHYDLVGGWRKSAELVSSHRFQVQSYHDNLAAVWPPEKSAASEAYLGRLKELIAYLTETHEAALANHDALAAATLSLSLAQGDVQKIYDEYAANQTLLQTFESQKQEKAAGLTPQPTPRPSGEEPPVAAGRQEELRQKAAVLLSGVSSDLAQAQLRLVRPKPYPSAQSVDDGPHSVDEGAFIAPPIPPIAPNIARDSSAASRSQRPSIPFSATNGAQFGTTPVTTPPQPGLILGGANPVLSPPDTGSALPPATTPSAGVTITNPSLLPTVPKQSILPSVPGRAFPGGGTAIAPPSAQPISRGVGLPREPLTQPGAAGPSPLPTSGIIGGASPVGIGQSARRQGLQRINPIGGVIGDGMPGALSTGAAAPDRVGNLATAYGQPGARKSSRSDASDTSNWDPDNPWETAKGVDPVVVPTREQHIDPGPAIGLS
jgi:hypothetical protein